MNLDGFKIVAAAHTPFHPDGSLNLYPIESLAQHYVKTTVNGVFVAGTTGEGQSLTVEERLALAERWLEVGHACKLEVIVHVGHNCQADCIRMATHAKKFGASAIALHSPSFFKPATVRDLVEFCVPVSAAAGGVPFYFYDIPEFIGVSLPMGELLNLGKDRIPHLAGIKYTNFDLVQFQECVRFERGSFEILFGCDEVLLAGIVLGARGAVGSTYNFAALLYRRMIQAFASGDLETARAEQAKSVELVRILSGFGYLAAAKAVMGMLGIECGPTRPPLLNLTPEARTRLKEDLKTFGFFS